MFRERYGARDPSRAQPPGRSGRLPLAGRDAFGPIVGRAGGSAGQPMKGVPVKSDMRSRWLVAAAVLATATAMVVAAPSSASTSGTTYTITTVKTLGTKWLDVAPKGITKGRFSPGDQLVETNDILRDGRVHGEFVGSATIVSPGIASPTQAVGMIRATYRFPDGDLYVDGWVSFATTAGSGAIVGGTGAFVGARGTLKTEGSKDILHLLP